MKTQVTGTVKKFKGNGRKLGYPTANLAIETDLQDGVYFGHADLAEFQDNPALIFVGVPTTMGDKVRRVEVHLLDIPDQDYYGEELSASIEKFHRKNQTFDSIEALLQFMHKDEATARAYFSNENIA